MDKSNFLKSAINENVNIYIACYRKKNTAHTDPLYCILLVHTVSNILRLKRITFYYLNSVGVIKNIV